MTDTPTIDLSKIQPGDEVTVRGTVARVGTDYRGLQYVMIDSPYEPRGAKVVAVLSNIATHTPKPKPLEVGDRVRWAGDEWEVAGPRRYSQAGDEFSLWNETKGYVGAPANEPERIQRSSRP